MSRWISQRQVRDKAHAVTRIQERHAWESDEEIAIFISALIGNGFTVDRSDSISVTLRSPTDVFGDYSFVHCWKEGS